MYVKNIISSFNIIYFIIKLCVGAHTLYIYIAPNATDVARFKLYIRIIINNIPTLCGKTFRIDYIDSEYAVGGCLSYIAWKLQLNNVKWNCMNGLRVEYQMPCF